MAVRVTSPGQDTYYLRYKDANGKTRHQKIGRTTDIDLDQARKRARTLNTELLLGIDRWADENAKKSVLSFDEFFREHYLPHAKMHMHGWKKDSQMYDLRLKHVFGNKRLNLILRHEIQSLHAGLRNDGLSPAYADRFLALIRHALNLVVDWDMLDRNPAAGVKLFNPDNRVEHYLDDDELKRLLMTLRTDRNRAVCSIAPFLLSTGARINEALQEKWKDINRENRVWRVPAANAKSKRARLVPLNSFAMKDVPDQLDSEDKYVHLFINRRSGKPFTTIYKTFAWLATDANLNDWTLHSCRHNYASLLINSGRTLFECSADTRSQRSKRDATLRTPVDEVIAGRREQRLGCHQRCNAGAAVRAWRRETGVQGVGKDTRLRPGVSPSPAVPCSAIFRVPAARPAGGACVVRSHWTYFVCALCVFRRVAHRAVVRGSRTSEQRVHARKWSFRGFLYKQLLNELRRRD